MFGHQYPEEQIDMSSQSKSFNDNDSMRPIVEDEVGSSMPLKPLFMPGSTTDTGKDIKDLQLSQNQGTLTCPASDPATQSSINPLKRGAESSDPPESFPETAEHRLLSNRGTKALSGGLFINKDKDPDFCHEIGTSRKPYGSIKHLFDFNTDNVSSVHIVNQPKNFDKSSTQPAKLEVNQSAPANGTDAGPSYMDTDTELDAEILLQPETRPISHDQLVVEIKGIYAGLLMAEAKCVDVDEKQSLEAQEKVSSRQKRLSNEKWQTISFWPLNILPPAPR